jgi:hypothetical protein
VAFQAAIESPRPDNGYRELSRAVLAGALMLNA